MAAAGSDPECAPADDISAEDAELIERGLHPDPFAVLGPSVGQRRIVAHLPGALRAWACNDTEAVPLQRHPHAATVFVGAALPFYRLRIEWPGGVFEEREDPYRFGPVLGEIDEHLIGEGAHRRLWHVLGAHTIEHEGQAGVHFAVWAPNARRVSVIGDFNGWNPTAHPMRARGVTGVWELFVPGVVPGARYKYDVVGPGDQALPAKADPVGFGAEHPPATASVVRRLGAYRWRHRLSERRRAARNAPGAPISIYEVHLGSWRRVGPSGRPLSYLEHATELVDYVADLGFTHLEVLPVTEHPFDGSWGYQPVGMYAPTIRYGTPEEFAAFVDAAHAKNLGVIADWVPGHFPTDPHGLGRFDGTALYEHQDAREGFHPDWNTFIYNYGRPEVTGFLVANALYWIEEFRLDGLRVDAVASMISRDYSRAEGEWIPNRDGGRDNYEAIAFLRETNQAVAAAHPGVAMIAEESTAFPGVTAPVEEGGLGFSFKWNLGWMNDTLRYFGTDPLFRSHHRTDLTFGITYAFHERFVLPISHDEVVHGKGSLYGRMPGSHADKLGNVKAFLGLMWGYPGKKLLFMGQEFAQPHEWNHDDQLDWAVLADPGHRGVQQLVRDLNGVYRTLPALHREDRGPHAFQWLLLDAVDDQVYAWVRRGDDADPLVVVVVNLTPVERTGYRVGFPMAGRWREVLNTDAAAYGGANRGNTGAIETEPVRAGAEAQSALLTLPPLSAIYFVQEAA